MNHWLSPEGLIGEAQRWLAEGEDFCIATLIAARGSVPQDLGAKILIGRNGIQVSTIGGGKLEAAVMEYARNLLGGDASEGVERRQVRTPQVKTWNLQTDLGMSCGGEATVLFEAVMAQVPLEIAVFGAGHIGQALVPLLLKLNTKVFWFDERREWLEQGPPEGKRLRRFCLPALDDGDKTPLAPIAHLSASSFIVSVTRGHSVDLKVLRAALPRAFPYVGVIGSEVKAKALRRQLREEGFSEEQVNKFYCPIGEPFGSNQPNEIAFSIIAQILKVRDH